MSTTDLQPERATTTRSTVLVAVFAALIAAMGLVPPITIGVLPVPITLQTLGVMLAGAMLGSVRGMLAAVIVVVLSLAGLPVLAGGRGGLGVLVGPTGGYLIGWIPGAGLTGLLVQRWAIRIGRPALRFTAVLAAAIIGGIGAIYLIGVPWTSVVTGLPLTTSILGSLIFVPGDLIKAVLAALAAVTVHRSYRGLLPQGRRAGRR
ncbi:biotin transporter BioY [Microlunatus soli]|uniref:Biotin transporter n=1 Tax=Microlunatus soli TaxID=630515 RepID=A0A1H1Z2R9_9ACTN|nr:biotin transporter BioY [Microlunatus soli]SDT28031.1 biotin transport system substrate-specific component [Microlunatus soli]